MPFSDLSPHNEELQKISQALWEHAKGAGVDPQLFPLLQGVFNWREYLLHQSSPEATEALTQYLRTMGYMPNSVSAAVRGSPELIGQTTDRIVHDLINGSLNATQLTKEEPVALKALYPDLTKPQIELLQRIVTQSVNLHALDVSSLVQQLPFPVTQVNFFGRFLAGGCDTPERAARHLQVANPFLIRMRSLFEGLAHNTLHFIQLELLTPNESGNKQQTAAEKKQASEAQRLALDIVHATVNNCADFYKDIRSPSTPKLRCIMMPPLPDLSWGHIDRKQWPELAVAVFDWLCSGRKENPLLHSKSLTSSREALAVKYATQLETAKKELRTLEDKAPSETAPAGGRRKHQHEARRIQVKIERIESNLEDLNDERDLIVPIIRQLEHQDEGLRMYHTRRFRKEIEAAQAAGTRPVLSFFGHVQQDAFGSMLELLELAYNAPRDLRASPSVAFFRQSAFLLNSSAAERLSNPRSKSQHTIYEHHLRTFTIDTSEINASVRCLISGILPKREDPKLSMLTDLIASHVAPPGIQLGKQLTLLVEKASGKRNPSAEDIISYTFEHRSTMSQEQLFTLLNALHELNIPTLPESARKISAERFKHPTSILRAFEVYARHYRPNKLGDLPEIFTSRASFDDYLASGIDAFGVEPEVTLLQKHLTERGIVAVVDGTNYHPELDASIGATGDKLQKSDAEKTTEVWGDYVRPSERVVRALAVRMMEGDVHPDLRNSTLAGIAPPDKVSQVQQKLIKKFYGIDIDINPDLSKINQVLADLKIHDDKTILVIDAHTIKDLEQYRQFIGLLERYQIKIVLRTREAFPGIPLVNLQPFLENSLTSRIMSDATRLQAKLDLAQPLDATVVQFAVQQVQRCRQPQADPLNLTLQVLHGAAAHARLHPDRTMTEQDVVSALPSIFHLPDGQQMRLRINAIDSFVARAPLQVLGQEQAIRKIGDKVTSHILGMRDPTRPLTLLIPGPTGVGKTELMMFIARICDIPFFMVEGAEFSEEHTVSRLVGSPTGYQGPDEGILYTFLKDNSVGLVFIDEIEKMHPNVYQALMNFFDKATLTAGNGQTISRPGFIIVGASNAGADKLTRDMDIRQVKEILSEAFIDRLGRPRPELVRRFDPIVMAAVEESAFKQMLHNSIDSIGSRPGFVNANLRLLGFDDAAVELLYKKSREVCEFNEKAFAGSGRIGFGPQSAPAQSGLFYDMRHVGRALDELAGESLRQMALTQYETGAHSLRGKPLRVRFVGDLQHEKISVVPVADVG